MTNPAHQETAVSPIPPRSGPDPGKNTLSEARRGVFSEEVDPQQPPRRKRPFWLPVVAALVIAGLGRAAWPVIDVSAVAQLVETVRLVTEQLDEVTTSKEALLGQVANYTGLWDDLTGEAYELSSTAQSLPTIEAEMLRRRNAENNAWPDQTAVRDAYASQPDDVITQVLVAHQARTSDWDEDRAAWSDAQIVIASAGQFLDAVQTTASTQNSTTDPGLSAQLDRQIAVSSAARDIAAKQLEVAVSAEQRDARLNHLRAVDEARGKQQALRIRTEINDVLTQQQADFDRAAFDAGLYTPALPRYH